MMRSKNYGRYIEEENAIKVCNKINMPNINETNIFRCSENGGVDSIIVVSNNKLAYIETIVNDKIYNISVIWFKIYNMNNTPQVSFNNLSYEEKQNILNGKNKDMAIYENKYHPDIIFGTDAWGAKCCIKNDCQYDRINLDILNGMQECKI